VRHNVGFDFGSLILWLVVWYAIIWLLFTAFGHNRRSYWKSEDFRDRPVRLNRDDYKRGYAEGYDDGRYAADIAEAAAKGTESS
jgi:hypothetical protein